MNVRAANGSGIADWRRTPVQILVAILAIGVLAGFTRAAMIVPLHVPLDPNEGWNAYHAAAAMAGNPYPPPGSFMINNYPPLSFNIVGLVGAWVGDNIVAGRIVSLAAFASICVFIAIALRRMDVSSTIAGFAGLLFASVLLLTSDYVGMNDPQLLGHGFQLAGLLFLLHRARNNVRVLASACFFVAGGFVKHNLFALPLVSLAWLVAVDRQSAVRFAAGLLTASLVGFVAVQILLGVDLLHKLNSARTFAFAQLASNLLAWLPIVVSPLCALVWLRFRYAKDQAVSLVSLYAAISILSGVALSGGAGVDVNAMFDADIALLLCVGVALSCAFAEPTAGRHAVAQIFAALCVVPLAVIALRAPDWRDASFWLSPMRDDAAVATADIAFLRAHTGPAMCENLAFCYWAGKPASVDVFNLDQQFETGARDNAQFLGLIRSRHFRSVELDETATFPFPNNVKTVFLRNYRIDHQDDQGTFFVPR